LIPLSNPGEDRPVVAASTLTPAFGLGLVALCAVLFFGGGLALAGSDPVWSLSLLPVLAFLMPSLLCARLLGAGAQCLPSSRPAWNGLLAGVSLTLGASLLALAVAGLISRLTGLSDEEVLIAEFIARFPLVQRVLLFAAVPAVCEEALFRGVLLASLRRWGFVPACLTSGLLFALFHGSPLRLAPVAILGVALAAVVWTTNNVWLAVAGHALHNLLVLAASHLYGAGVEPSARALALWAAGGIVLVVAGSWLAARDFPPQR
jgi:membrane protease YdiL (CAAX protease family)